MSALESIEVPWTTSALTAIGFTPVDASRLAPRLPPIEAGTLVVAERHRDGTFLTDDQPAAGVIWYIHGLGASQTRRLARAGRGVLDVLVILDTIATIKQTHLWQPTDIDLACQWASERTVPRDRIALYLHAGIPPEEAAAFETDPATRPTHGDLQFLAALRPAPSATRDPR